MASKRKKPDDLKNLVNEDGSKDGNQKDNPLIQISHPNVPDSLEEQGGVENPVFTLGDEEEEADAPIGVKGKEEAGEKVTEDHSESNKPSHAEVKVPPLHVSASSPRLRRDSHPLQHADSLQVPNAKVRRHSVSSTDDSLSVSTGNGYLNTSVSSANLLSPSMSRSQSITWLEIERLEKRRGSTGSVFSDGDPSDERPSELSSVMSNRLKDLARRFSERTERFKQQAIQPPTPSTTESDAKSAVSGVSDVSKENTKDSTNKLMAVVEAKEAEVKEKPVRYWKKGCCKIKVPDWWEKLPSLREGIDPQSRAYLGWLALITFVYMYNAVACTLRAAFRSGYFYVHPEELDRWNRQHMSPPVTECIMTNYTQNGSYVTSCFVNVTQEEDIPPFPRRIKVGYETEENRYYWWAIDYFCDLLYIMDMLLVRGRIGFIRNGLYETSPKECWKNYRSKPEFKLDLFSLLPLDLLYLIPEIEYNAIVRLPRLSRYDIMSLTPLEIFYLVPAFNYSSLLRLPRVLRIHICWEFFDRLDQAAKSGHIIRVIRTMTYMLYLIHIEGCGYYAMSAYEGFGFNDWVYSGNGNAYIHCMYLATKTATSIGNNPKPIETVEYGFMTVYWLSGVFVFAMLIGQIRDIFQSATAAETSYRRSMDRAVSYMQGLNVPKELQDKVRSWFNYNWEHQKTLNENSLLEGLPVKMMADLQIAVHFQTLSKVQLFQDCEKNLLFDLVVKLKPVLYLPRDYICKKGEVGTEMYIVKTGQVEVVGGENDSLVFATLHEGSVFGEISLLGIQGGNRRTASVRSKGFSNLFVLTKNDFEAAMRDYPEAHKLLKKRSKKVLAKNQKKVEEVKKETEEIIIASAETPKMVQTVISLLEPESKLQHMLRRGSIRSRSLYSEDGTLSPTESIRGDLDLLSNLSEDEILRVEMTEQILSPDAMAKLTAQGQTLGTPEPAVTITMEDLAVDRDAEEALPEEATSELDKACGDVHKTGDEGGTTETSPGIDTMNLINSAKSIKEGLPTDETPTTANHNALKKVGNNKIHPAEIIIEKETAGDDGTPSKKSSANKKRKSTAKLTRSNRIEPVNGVPPGKEKMDESKEAEIPEENRITCDVEVHREKSPSLTSINKDETRNGDVPKRRDSPDNSRQDTPV